MYGSKTLGLGTMSNIKGKIEQFTTKKITPQHNVILCIPYNIFSHTKNVIKFMQIHNRNMK